MAFVDKYELAPYLDMINSIPPPTEVSESASNYFHMFKLSFAKILLAKAGTAMLQKRLVCETISPSRLGLVYLQIDFAKAAMRKGINLHLLAKKKRAKSGLAGPARHLSSCVFVSRSFGYFCRS